MKRCVLFLMLAFVVSCAPPKGDSIVGHPGLDGSPGRDGKDGSDAPPTAYTVTEIIDPCGDDPSLVDEVLLKMANGQILVYFTNNKHGDYGRLAVLPDGTYMTTDGQNCVFTVNNGTISY